MEEPFGVSHSQIIYRHTGKSVSQRILKKKFRTAKGDTTNQVKGSTSTRAHFPLFTIIRKPTISNWVQNWKNASVLNKLCYGQNKSNYTKPSSLEVKENSFYKTENQHKHKDIHVWHKDIHVYFHNGIKIFTFTFKQMLG